MNPNQTQSHEDHTRAALYFECRNALKVIGEEEIDAILKQAKEDHKITRSTK